MKLIRPCRSQAASLSETSMFTILKRCIEQGIIGISSNSGTGKVLITNNNFRIRLFYKRKMAMLSLCLALDGRGF
jgi:hypothetical protein